MSSPFRSLPVRKLLTALLGSAILAFGLCHVHAYSGVTEGGVLGLTLLLQHWLGISPSASGLVLNAACYLAGWRTLGRSFVLISLVAGGGFSLFYALFELLPPMFPMLAGHPLAAAVAGALFVGVGVGLVVRAGGASGGDDALALVISKVTGWPVSRAYLFTDVVVLALSLSYIPVRNIACSLVTVTLSSFIIGKIHTAGRH